MTESVLKVGDKRKWNEEFGNGEVFTVLCIGKKEIFCEYLDGHEDIELTHKVLENSTPYQEPAPVRKIMAFKSNLTNEIKLAEIEVVGEDVVNFFQTKEWFRIELTKEMFGWGE